MSLAVLYVYIVVGEMTFGIHSSYFSDNPNIPMGI